MVYVVQWFRHGRVFTEAQLITRDEVVVEATRGLAWAVGKHVSTVRAWCAKKSLGFVLKSVDPTLEKK